MTSTSTPPANTKMPDRRALFYNCCIVLEMS
jgi:hypothetical protein